MELVADKKDPKDMTEEELAELGRPISGMEELSTIKLKCSTCQAHVPPLQSKCYIIAQPRAFPTEPPYWNEDGEYIAGKQKLAIPILCSNGHSHVITVTDNMVYDLGR